MWHSVARDPQTAALETLSYFAELAYPLTPLEIWRFSFFRCSYEEVIAALKALEAAGRVVMKDGKWTLAGFEAVFEERELRYRNSLRKLRRAERATRFLCRIGFIRAVFVCNTLALMHARDASDIDLFIIVKSGSVWRTRLLAVIPFIALGMRASVANERDGLCFSFFLADNQLDLRRLRVGDADPYMAFWGASLLPLYDPDGLLCRLREASGLNELFPQSARFEAMPKGTTPRFVLGETPFGARLEAFARRLQYPRLPEEIRSKNGQGTDVVVTDDVLKFHTLDRRVEIRDRFIDRLKAEGLL